MVTTLKKHFSVIVACDAISLYVALYISIFVRTMTLPEWWYVERHLRSFSAIFVLWFLVFYVAGLYDIRSALKEVIVKTLLHAQVVNSILAVIVFFLVPSFGIAPKTTLFIDLIISTCLLLSWRLYYYRSIVRNKGEDVLIIGNSFATNELRRIIPNLPIFGLKIVDKPPASTVILDLYDQLALRSIPGLDMLMFSGTNFLKAQDVYEGITGRVTLDTLSDAWVLENISLQPKLAYTTLKRVMDIVIALPLFLISLVLYPFVAVAIRLEDQGPIFISQERVGENGRHFKMHKFRSMNGNDNGEYKEGSTTLRVTHVGTFLRKSRIDELPQLVSVLVGNQSLVGPRPELPALVERYCHEIAYYNVRHVIKPGMSGWAQIYHEDHPHHGTAVEQTREKLSYDLYYIKNRSFVLDLKIALKTIRVLLSRVGA